MWCGLLSGSDSKESACNVGNVGSIQVGKIPWRREWLPTPVFLPGELHGQRSLAGYSPWGHKELGMTDSHFHLLFLVYRWHLLSLSSCGPASVCAHTGRGSELSDVSYFLNKFIGVLLFYNVALDSSVQQSASATRVGIYPLFSISFPFRPLQGAE